MLNGLLGKLSVAAMSARHRRLRSSAVLVKYRGFDSAALHLPEDQNTLFKKLQTPELSK